MNKENNSRTRNSLMLLVIMTNLALGGHLAVTSNAMWLWWVYVAIASMYAPYFLHNAELDRLKPAPVHRGG